jgi:hypothetical protein
MVGTANTALPPVLLLSPCHLPHWIPS